MFFCDTTVVDLFYSALVHPLGTFIAIQMTGAVVKRILRDSENMNFEKSAEIRHPSITRQPNYFKKQFSTSSFLPI